MTLVEAVRRLAERNRIPGRASGKKDYLGTFGTAVEAAVAYEHMRSLGENAAAEPEEEAAEDRPRRRPRRSTTGSGQKESKFRGSRSCSRRRVATREADRRLGDAQAQAESYAAAARGAGGSGGDRRRRAGGGTAESPLEVHAGEAQEDEDQGADRRGDVATMCKAALDADHAAFLKTLGA